MGDTEGTSDTVTVASFVGVFDGLDVRPVGLLDRTKEGELDTDGDGVVTVILSLVFLLVFFLSSFK